MEYVNEGLPTYIKVDTQHQGAVLRSRGNTLDDVYGRYSDAKACAYARCKEICDEMNGSNLCIISANTWFFSAQFEFCNPINGRPMVWDVSRAVINGDVARVASACVDAACLAHGYDGHGAKISLYA